MELNDYKGPEIVEGYLKKLKKLGATLRFFSKYVKRWFVLDLRTKTFSYFKDIKKTRPLKAHLVQDIMVVHSNPRVLDVSDWKFVLVVETRTKTYTLYAEAASSHALWTTALLHAQRLNMPPRRLSLPQPRPVGYEGADQLTNVKTVQVVRSMRRFTVDAHVGTPEHGIPEAVLPVSTPVILEPELPKVPDLPKADCYGPADADIPKTQAEPQFIPVSVVRPKLKVATLEVVSVTPSSYSFGGAGVLEAVEDRSVGTQHVEHKLPQKKNLEREHSQRLQLGLDSTPDPGGMQGKALMQKPRAKWGKADDPFASSMLPVIERSDLEPSRESPHFTVAIGDRLRTYNWETWDD
jgi:hypothetical protein